MNIERTMEFILQQQAKAEARAERYEAKAAQAEAKAEARAERYEARAAQAEAKAERQMAAIRKLIQIGMRMIVKNEELIKATHVELRELAAVQKVTEKKLQSFIDSMRRTGNGNHRKN